MIIAILSLGGVILGATTLAGLLMLYNIRSTTDSINSAKAIFAADSGINWALYSYFKPPDGPLPGNNGTLLNGATVSITCYDAKDNPLGVCDNTSGSGATSSYTIAEGLSGGSRRAFLVSLAVATATLP